MVDIYGYLYGFSLLREYQDNLYIRVDCNAEECELDKEPSLNGPNRNYKKQCLFFFFF